MTASAASLSPHARHTANPEADDAYLRALVERVQRNELMAFDELYRLTRHEMARTLFHLVGRRCDLEDLLQETYLRLLKALGTFRGESKVRTFLYRVCANVALMHLRWWRRRREETARDFPERLELWACDDDPEQAAFRRQAARLVERALENMSPKKRVVFVYHELCGMGPEEIAAAVGSSYNTVRSRLHHARLEFARELDKLLKVERGVS